MDEDGQQATGITVYGVPIGSPEYVRWAVERKADEIISTIHKHDEALREYPHHMMSMAGYSLQHRFTYWLRTRTPAHTRTTAERVEAAMHKLIEKAANNQIRRGTTT